VNQADRQAGNDKVGYPGAPAAARINISGTILVGGTLWTPSIEVASQREAIQLF